MMAQRGAVGLFFGRSTHSHQFVTNEKRERKRNWHFAASEDGKTFRYFEEKNNGGCAVGSRGCYFPLLRNVKEGREEGGKTIDRRTNPQRVEEEEEEEEVRGDGKKQEHTTSEDF